MVLLIDIGNTHTHLGLATPRRVVRQMDISTASLRHAHRTQPPQPLVRFCQHASTIDGVCFCSVVPQVTAVLKRTIKALGLGPALELNHQTVTGLGIDYPQPHTIGPDRLANAVAARHRFGAPSVVVDFGTAVTFDVINRQGNYAGGIIAPGLAAMTSYLHEKTALLPAISIRQTSAVIGKNTRQAMLIGAVHGYRGLIKELLGRLKSTLRCGRLPVVATGGYAKLMASGLPAITAVDPLLTLEGLRLVWISRTAG